MAWTWKLCDLEQTVLAELDDRYAGGRVEIGRHTARLASGEIAWSDDAADLITTGDTVLQITDDLWTDPVFVGRINTNTIQVNADAESISFTAADPLPLLGQRIVRESASFDVPTTVTGFIWGEPSVASQPADLLNYLIFHFADDVGIDIGTLPGGATARTFTFPLGSSVLDSFLSVTGLDDSVEFELTPTLATDGTLVTLNAYYPNQGTDLSNTVSLRVGIDDADNLTDFAWEEALADQVNRHLAVGDVIGTATRGGLEFPLHHVYIAESPASVAQYGALESSSSASGVMEQTVLEDLAKAVVKSNAYPVASLGGTLDPTLDFDFSPDGDFWIGDTVLLAAGLPQETLLLTGRVATASLTEDENGEIEVAVSCEPEPADDVTGTLYYALIDAADGTAPPPPETPEPPEEPETPASKKKVKKKKKKK